MAYQLRGALGVEGEAVSGDKTLDITDSGFLQNVTASATITLPATASGGVFIIRNGGSGSTDGAVTVTISPAAADSIAGMGSAATDNKDIINTLGGAGEYVVLVPTTVGYLVAEHAGTWVRES